MTLTAYCLTVYGMVCAVVFVVTRTTIRSKSLRLTFFIVGALAPFFFAYILFRTLFRPTELTSEQRVVLLKVADAIEQERIRRYGGRHSFTAKFKVEYVRTLETTAEKIETFVEKAA